MSEFKVSLNANILSQNIAQSFGIYQDSYEVSSFVLHAGASNVEVNVAPIVNADDLSILMIKSSAYSSITYRMHLIGNPVITLNNMHSFFGEGQLGSLINLPDKLFMSNGSSHDVTITIMTARNAESSASSVSSHSSLSHSSHSSSSHSSHSSHSSIL
jgi:hypothetical protein